MKVNNRTESVIPFDFLERWQETADIMAQVYDVPVCLIMKANHRTIEVLVASHSEGNPYVAGKTETLGQGFYCETVIKTCDELYVPNAYELDAWKDNPDINMNMIMYLGVPLVWPSSHVFGTICILDERPRFFLRPYHRLIWEFKKKIENDFKLLITNEELKEFHDQLIDREVRIIQMKEEVNTLCEALGRSQAYPPIWEDPRN